MIDDEIFLWYNDSEGVLKIERFNSLDAAVRSVVEEMRNPVGIEIVGFRYIQDTKLFNLIGTYWMNHKAVASTYCEWVVYIDLPHTKGSEGEYARYGSYSTEAEASAVRDKLSEKIFRHRITVELESQDALG